MLANDVQMICRSLIPTLFTQTLFYNVKNHSKTTVDYFLTDDVRDFDLANKFATLSPIVIDCDESSNNGRLRHSSLSRDVKMLELFVVHVVC